MASTSSTSINASHFFESLSPVKTYFSSLKKRYASMNGPVIKRNGLYLKADGKSNFTIETIILVIPHPGHFMPVNS